MKALETDLTQAAVPTEIQVPAQTPASTGVDTLGLIMQDSATSSVEYVNQWVVPGGGE